METEKLKQILLKLSRCINKKSTLSVNKCIKFTNGSLIVSDNENIFIITVPELNHLNCFVELEYIKKIVDKIKVDNIELFQTDTTFIIKTLKGEFTLPLYFDSDNIFVELPTIESEPDLFITETHVELMENAVSYCTNDPLRPTLSGVFLHESGYIAASNSLTLYYPSCQSSFGKSSIISQKAISLLEKKLYIVEQDSEYIAFIDEDTQLISKKIKGSFFDFKALLPTEFNTTVTLLKKDIKECIELAMLSCNSRSNLCRFEITDKFTLISEDIEYNKTYKNVIDSKITGEPITIGFDLRNLQQIFSVNYVNVSEAGELTSKRFVEEVDEFIFKIRNETSTVIINDLIAIYPAKLY